MNKKTNLWQRIFGKKSEEGPLESDPRQVRSAQGEVKPLNLPANDPLLAYISNSPGVIEVDKLNLDSPTLNKLKEQDFKLALPLVSQGELIGLLNLGSRMSEQEYSSDDYRLLNNLATQASPALRVAQLARQQLDEAQERERLEQELRVARIIQETLLPKELPELTGWRLEAFWQPAREVSGDFYDFIFLPNNRLGVLVADVTDKGVPAAMVMATSRSILRAASERILEPGDVLARANDLLHPDIPARMFVTCLYLVLDPENGKICYANAGHNLPYLLTSDGVVELRATGMPLGLMPGMEYEQKEITLKPGQTILLSSDGIVEAHNKQREMFSFQRLKDMMAAHGSGDGMISSLMRSFSEFVGENYEQEDDITLAVIERLEAGESSISRKQDITTIADFQVPSAPGNERDAAREVVEVVEPLGLSEKKMQRLETAIAESVMNAMEHGNGYDHQKAVDIKVRSDGENIRVYVSDEGTGDPIPDSTSPDLEAKLEGAQSPRGWGLFLIKNMVDEMNVIQEEDKHTIELVISIKES